MGGEVRGHFHSLVRGDTLAARLAAWLAKALEPDERESVLGDFAEEQTRPATAIAQLLGLILRRQAEPWRGWRPWLTLGGLLLPCAVLLAVVSASEADGNAIYIWFFANNWDGPLLHQPGYWRGLWETAPGILVSGLALISWSWTFGTALGSASRSTFRVNGLLLVLLLVGLVYGGLPLWTGHVLLLGRARDFQCNAAVFANVFYREFLTPIVQVLLVLFPALQAMRQAQQPIRTPGWARWIFWSFLALSLFSLVTQGAAWWQVHSWNTDPVHVPHLPDVPHLPSLLPLALAGPLGYLIARYSARLELPRSIVSSPMEETL